VALSTADHVWAPEDGPSISLIIGVGLIGGSIALALRETFPKLRIVGVDRAPTLLVAKDRGVLDRGYPPEKLDQALAEQPQLIVLATGIQTIVDVLATLAAHQQGAERPARLILDVGSVKQPINAAAERLRLPHFVGGHPMSGRERGGIEQAEVAVLAGCRFVLCPTDHGRDEDLRTAEALVTRCGWQPLVMSPLQHDRCAAMVSHLPHLAAWTLMAAAHGQSVREGDPELPWSLAAGSWRDATRVAAANPDLWEGILHSNRAEVRHALDLWLEALGRVRRSLDAGDGPILDALDASTLAELRRRLAPRLKP